MLELKHLSIQVGEKEVLKNISCKFEEGKNYCVLGKNGSGKSSLAMAIMGNPKYQITNGEILIDKISIKELHPHQRAKLGIFLAFQQVPEIKGVKLFEFLRAIYDAKHESTTSFIQFKKIIEPYLEELKIPKEFLRRELNVGFSGGEKRKIEVLQLKLLEPKYIILDEIDSGLDVDAFRDVAELIQSINHSQNTFIIITHLFDILEYVQVDGVFVLQDGKLIKESDKTLIQKIKDEGFQAAN